MVEVENDNSEVDDRFGTLGETSALLTSGFPDSDELPESRCRWKPSCRFPGVAAYYQCRVIFRGLGDALMVDVY